MSLLGLLPVTQALAQTKGVPPVIRAGLDVYLGQGAAAAVKAWLKDSPVERDAPLISNTTAGLLKTESSYGRFVGHEVLQSARVGSRAERTYVMLLFERGPLYVSFDTYRSSKGWIVTGFSFNTSPDAILPRSQFEGTGPRVLPAPDRRDPDQPL